MPSARWAGPADKAGVQRLFSTYLDLQGERIDKIRFAKTWRASLGAATRFRFAVIEDDDVVAFATIHDTFSSRLGDTVIRIEDLFVDPEHSGRGHRQALVAFAEDHGRRHGAKQVDVFLQYETSLDPDFLPNGYEPLPSPPFRKRLDAKQASRPGARAARKRTRPPQRRRQTAKRSDSVPTGKDLANVFR